MKKWLFIITVPILLVILGILIIDNTEKDVNKILSISKLNNYILEEDNIISIPFYVNNLDLNYDKNNIYNDFYIKNYEETIVLPIELKEVTYSHNETYNKQNYYKFVLKFYMLDLSESLYIDDAYLTVNFINLDKVVLRIGAFNIYTNDLKEINEIKNLYANRESGVIINEIILEGTNIETNINHIHFGDNIYLEYKIIEDKIIINTEEISFYIDNIPIIIETNNYTYYLNNFTFIEDYLLLKSKTKLINEYQLN